MTRHLTAVATMSYAEWSSTGNYESLRDSTTYEWMDWSQDGCSSPPGLDLAYAEDFHFLRTGTVLRGSSDGVRHPQAGGTCAIEPGSCQVNVAVLSDPEV